MITISSLWIAALALLVLFLALSVRKVHRKIWCPIRGTEVQLSLLESAPEGRPIEVTACSAFTPPTAVTCDQRCLGRRHVLRADGRRHRASRSAA
jgi:predicted nucleic acid-binding Zn ribbon protein